MAAISGTCSRGRVSIADSGLTSLAMTLRPVSAASIAVVPRPLKGS